jgi:hypothetical protein
MSKPVILAVDGPMVLAAIATLYLSRSATGVHRYLATI